MTDQPQKPARKRNQKRQELPPVEERAPGIAGNPNKYANRPRVGRPTIGKSPNYVETVGLGNLKVVSAHGNDDV